MWDISHVAIWGVLFVKGEDLHSSRAHFPVCQFTIYIISSFVMSAMVHERSEKLQRRVDGHSGYKDEDAFDYMVG